MRRLVFKDNHKNQQLNARAKIKNIQPKQQQLNPGNKKGLKVTVAKFHNCCMSCIIQELTGKVKKWSQCPMLAHHHHQNHATVFVPVRHLSIHIHTNLPPHATHSLAASELDSMFLHRTEPERMSSRPRALIEWNLTGTAAGRQSRQLCYIVWK